jgi:hypothetical protein
MKIRNEVREGSEVKGTKKQKDLIPQDALNWQIWRKATGNQ